LRVWNARAGHGGGREAREAGAPIEDIADQGGGGGKSAASELRRFESFPHHHHQAKVRHTKRI
jgi:hypothetical protein